MKHGFTTTHRNLLFSPPRGAVRGLRAPWLCLCLRLHRIEEVARVDEEIRLLPDDRIHCRKEIIVDLLLAHVHAAFRVEPVERGETQVGVGDVDELHFLDC